MHGVPIITHETTGNPAENLRRDDELLITAAPILRTWEAGSECVVLGVSGKLDRDVDIDACRRSNIPILRRSSGGGAVLLGPGCLNYSLVLPLADHPALRDVRHSLCWVMTRLRHVLDLPGLTLEGDSDLAFHNRKVSGNAQRRTRDAILHHGTLLYDFDLTRPALFLRPPHRQPAYRANRPHADFLTNLPLSAGELRQRLTTAFA